MNSTTNAPIGKLKAKFELVVMKFVHLHSHSHYSLLDGLPKIGPMVERAKEQGMDALALTDHGVLYGAIEFYKKAIQAGIKPIVGMETYMAPHKLTQKRSKIDDANYHLILLAKNREGYQHLMELTSIAHVEGFYYRPRIDKELLLEKHEGLIALSGCLGGELCDLIRRGEREKAKENIAWYAKTFGDGNFYVEVQDHPESSEQIETNGILLELASEMGIPAVLTKDFHYLHRDDAVAQDALLCVYQGKIVEDKNRLSMMDMDLHMASPEEIEASWSGPKEPIENTSRIAEQCQLELELGKWNFPSVEIPSGRTSEEELRFQTFEGAKKKFGENISDALNERLQYELDIIIKKGYASYFLSVADFVQHAKDHGIVTATRGSAGGSLVAYVLRITDVDPILYNLPFERFLNPYRPSAPDIDMDFADDRRHEMIEYATEKYGKDKVAQICTFGTMAAKGSVRDIGRVLGYPYSFCDRISKMIPPGSQGFPMTIKKALELNPDLKKLEEEDARVKRLLALAQKVEGCARHASVHAAGVVVAPTKLTDFTPLQKETKGDHIITQYEMHAVEDAGLVKYDFLGIRNLSILGNALLLVSKTKGVTIRLEDIPIDDPKTFKLLVEGQTVGLFQLNGSGMTKALKELCPSSIHDIMVMVALYRPGPIDTIAEYVARKHGKKTITYYHPKMEKFLDKSFGLLVYQDDLLYTAIELAGYNWEEVDKFRKAVGKKIPEEMAKQHVKFVQGCVQHSQMTEKEAEKIWELFEPFQGYGFNKAHAASYGMVAYQTAYMKAHFPTEYMASIMTAESGDIEKVAEIVRECGKMAIQVLPPSVNESLENFTYINDQTIRFGLLVIKNIGEGIVRAIIEERKKGGKFVDLTDFLTRVKTKDLNKKSLESLMKCGAMDEFGERGRMLANMENILQFVRNHQRESESAQTSIFGLLGGENARPIFTLEVAPEAESRQKLSWEKELIGLYISSHPFALFQELLDGKIVPLGRLREYSNRKIIISGIVHEVKQIMTRKGDRMLFVGIEDTTSMTELLVFPGVLEATNGLWEVDKTLLVEGKVSDKDGEPKILVEMAEEVTEEKAKHHIWDSIQFESSPTIAQQRSTQKFLFLKYQENLSSETTKDLKNLFTNFPGEHQVYFVVSKEGTNQKIRTPYQVEWNTYLERELTRLVGVENYKVIP